MTSHLTSTPAYSAGPTSTLSDDNIFTYCFSNPFQHTLDPNKSKSTSQGEIFEGNIIPPQRPSIVHAGTGATLSWQRTKADSLRIARYLHAIIGDPLPWDGKGGKEPIHSPQTTILLHLPNCLAFPLLLMGGAACLYSVTPISPMLMPAELANILAKARPQVLITTVGPEGEKKLRKGLQVLLDQPEKDIANLSGKEVKRWANELANTWDQGRRQKSQKGDKQPIRDQRVWTVNLSLLGGADYYGSSTRSDGVSSLADPRDWSNLLSPPPGHKHVRSLDSLSRDAFNVRKLTKEEQVRRVMLLLWSSGTTGESKGVLLSHRNVVASCNSCCLYSAPQSSRTPRGAYEGGETWIALAPWCHVMGMVTLLLPTFAIGATLVLPASPKFDLATYLRLATKYRATKLHIAPPVAVTLRSTPLLDKSNPAANGIDLSSVKSIWSGGAPTSTEVIKTIYKRTGIVLQIGYGTTEVGSLTQCDANDLTQSSSLLELGSAGSAMGNVELCIRPADGTTTEQTNKRFQEIAEEGKLKRKAGECAAVDPSLPGEVLTRGDHVMLGYYSGLASNQGDGAKDAIMTASAFTLDGYYRTGDEGVIDRQGQLWLIGRTKELIKVKGFQVPPAELDSLFAKHSETLDAAATGVLDASGAEQVVMYIVPRDGAVLKSQAKQRDLVERLAQFVTDKIAHYKCPMYYVFSPAVIKSPTGKILRKELHTLQGTRHVAPRQDRQSKM